MSATKTSSKKPAPQAGKPAAEAAPAATKPAPQAAEPKAAPSASAAPKAASAKKPATKARAAAAPRAVAKPAGASKPPAAAKPAKEPKVKKPAKVRDSFTMPEDEYSLLDALKARSLKAGRATKKSEVLRAGLQLLTQLGEAELLKALNALPQIKVGRPKK